MSQRNEKVVKDRFSPGGGPPYFIGWHHPSVRWNGFACPYFPWKSMVKIIAYLNDPDPIENPYNGCNDEFRIDLKKKKIYMLEAVQDRTSDSKWEEIKPMKLKGVKEPVWAFMSWCWCWEEKSREKN